MWLSALQGKKNPGERSRDGAVRETLEETGLDVRLHLLPKVTHRLRSMFTSLPSTRNTTCPATRWPSTSLSS